MEFISIFDTISLGTIVVYSCAIAFLGGAIFKFLEKYRKAKNELDDKTKSIDDHEAKIQAINTDISNLSDKVDTIIKQMKEFNDIYDQREARRLRREILKFSDGLRDGKIPSRDAFRDIINSNQEYVRLIAKTGCPNGYTEAEMEFVKSKYQKIYNVVEED